MNTLVVNSCYRALYGLLELPAQSGLCLQLVRLVIEDAYDLGPGAFYALRTTVVDADKRASLEPYARDMERSLRDRGWAVSQPYAGNYVNSRGATDLKAGDLLFRWDIAKDARGVYVGHVGILMPGSLVLENVNPVGRPRSLARGSTCLTPLWTWPVTTVVRLPSSLGLLTMNSGGR